MPKSGRKRRFRRVVYCSEPRLALNRTVVLRYRVHLEQKRYAPTTINLLPFLGNNSSLTPQGRAESANSQIGHSHIGPPNGDSGSAPGSRYGKF